MFLGGGDGEVVCLSKSLTKLSSTEDVLETFLQMLEGCNVLK